MQIPAEDLQYVTSLEEGVWGGILIAITLVIHGLGMIWTARASNALKHRYEHNQSFALGMGIVIVASWIIITVHLLEVMVWAAFFVWKNAMPTASLSYYFALMDYTTLGSNYNLPLRWRLLEGMIGIAGLMTFAWSTGVLLSLAQAFQDQQLQNMRRRREKPAHGSTPPAAPGPDHAEHS